VTQLDRIVCADRGDDVLALGVADAVRGDIDPCVGQPFPNDLSQGDGGAGGSVELGGVVGLVDVEAVSIQLG
jgi:hypothetical protein